MGLAVAWRCFWRALTDQRFADRMQPLLAPPPPEAPKKPSGEPLRLLALLQRDGRLIDFLIEEIADYSDEQIGAAVRDIHRDSRKTLLKYVELAPVIDKPEGANVDVAIGFDPARIRLTGAVKGSPPFQGSLTHRGWRAASLKLPEPMAGADDMLLAPAEVEIA